MTYDTYISVICFIVYVMLVTISVVVVATITKMSIKLIVHGAEDEKIKKEYKKACKKRKRGVMDYIISLLFSILFLGAFAFSLYVNIQGDKFFTDIPTIKVVNSASMSKKHKKNTYLAENNLNDQFQTFDLICLYQIPAEKDLHLYDIVLYEVEDTLIIHRIVGIEEPNQSHPDERYFLLQGDAVERADRFPVKYSQMKAIYRGERIPYVGSFVAFLQSPAGWLCIILIIVAIIASPIVEKKIEKEKRKRLAIILAAKGSRETKSVFAAASESQALPSQWGAPVFIYPVYYDPNSLKVGQAVPPATLATSKEKGKGGKQ